MSHIARLSIALLFCVPSIVLAADNLIFSVDIIRHGDRTPIAPLTSVNYQWKEGAGQLTAEGMQQEYKLGVEFRKKYIDQLHILPEHYEPGTMYVRSTDYNRTLMSAESLLMGLYPLGTGPHIAESLSPALPNAFQPIPVFSAPSKYDDIIVQQVNHEEQIRLMEEYVYSTKEWQQKNNELKDKYPLWSSIMGIQIDNLDDLHLLADALFVHQVHNIPMPAGLSATDIQTIIEAGNWAFMAHVRPKPIANVYSHKVMSNIAHYLQTGSEQKSKLKYVLLSAHDVTIANVMSFIGAPLEKVPPYASNVNFSLYNHGANYIVKVTYNGKPITIPACGSDVCDLQQFTKLVNDSKN